MKLTTLRKVKQHIGIPSSNTTKDAILEQIIEGVSAFIETTTHRVFGVQEYREVRDGTDDDEIFLPQYPIVDVLSITINGNQDLDLDAEEEAETVMIDKEVGSIFRQYGFGSGRKALRISYTAGFNLPEASDESGPETYESGADNDLPAAIESAAIRLSARVYERRTAEGVASVSPTGISITYRDAVDADITTILDSFTKRRL